MHIETRGEGPPLLLLHGWAMHSGIFSVFAEHLSRRFTVYAVDLPGHGFSRDVPFALAPTREYLLELVRAASEPLTILGWSMGGTLACECALALARAQRLDRLRGLICIASTPKFVADPQWLPAMPLTHFERFYRDLNADWQHTVERFLALEALGASDEAAELRWLKANVFARGQPSPAALHAGLAFLEATDHRSELKLLRALPTLWIGGKRDRIVPPSAVQWAAEAAGGQAEIIERAAHAPFLSHPELVVGALEKLMAPP